MGGALARWVLDPFQTSEDPDATGYAKYLPRMMTAFLASDVICAAVLLGNLHAPCDAPVKLWLTGHLLLGFPTTFLVKNIARLRPAYRYYRLVATQLRGGADVANAQWGGLILYDNMNMRILQDQVTELQDGLDGAIWYATLEEEVMITSYAIITHPNADPALDPVCWSLECSADGRRSWSILDELQSDDVLVVPRGRGEATTTIENLAHVEDGNLVFRMSVLAELVASAASLGWLSLGTAWVSAGTEHCIDTAPLLWYPAFVFITAAWSVFLSACIAVILSAVATLFGGSVRE